MGSKLLSCSALKIHIAAIFTVATMIVANDYPGAVPCPADDTLIGYNNFTVLNLDIFSHFEASIEEGSEKVNYNYIICPNTTYTIENFAQTIIPATDDTSFFCGRDGSLENNCVIKGGDFQVYFLDILPLKDIVFRGFTFESAKTASVYGDAHPTSLVYFYDSVWKNSCGVSVAYIHFTPYIPTRRLTEGDSEGGRLQFPRPKFIEKFEVAYKKRYGELPIQQRKLQADTRFSMGVIFKNSVFKENVCRDTVILNIGGEVALSNTKFEDNAVDALGVFSTILNGHAYIGAGTSFVSNKAELGPVFVSANSYLQYSENSFGFNNFGSTCSTIFIEDDTANCVLPQESEVCTGSCCEFEDSTCDVHPDPTPSPIYVGSGSNFFPNASPTKGAVNQLDTEESQKTSSSGGCTGTCLAFSIVFPIVALIVLVGVFIFLRKRRSRNETYLFEEADLNARPGLQRSLS